MKLLWKERALKNLIEGALEAVFPSNIRCIFCGKEIMPGHNIYSLCGKCIQEMEINSLPRCIVCGRGISHGYSHVCNNCLVEGHTFDGGISPYVYEGVLKSLVMKFKYEDQRYLGKFFAEMIYDFDRSADNIIDLVDSIMPVPAHPNREKIRGFNQSRLLARELSKLTGKPVIEGAVERVRETSRLKELNREERKAEMARAFSFAEEGRNTKKIGNIPKSILICDDIMTTGYTLSSVEMLLRKAGVERVYIAVVGSKIS